jgi:hypothetical protein
MPIEQASLKAMNTPVPRAGGAKGMLQGIANLLKPIGAQRPQDTLTGQLLTGTLQKQLQRPYDYQEEATRAGTEDIKSRTRARDELLPGQVAAQLQATETSKYRGEYLGSQAEYNRVRTEIARDEKWEWHEGKDFMWRRERGSDTWEKTEMPSRYREVPRVVKTEVDAEGNIHAIMADGTTTDTGIKADKQGAEWSLPQIAGKDDPFGFKEGTMYILNGKTGKTQILDKPDDAMHTYRKELEDYMFKVTTKEKGGRRDPTDPEIQHMNYLAEKAGVTIKKTWQTKGWNHWEYGIADKEGKPLSSAPSAEAAKGKAQQKQQDKANQLRIQTAPDARIDAQWKAISEEERISIWEAFNKAGTAAEREAIIQEVLKILG